MHDDEDDYTVEMWKELTATSIAMLVLGIFMLVVYIVMAVAVGVVAMLPIACLYYGFNLPLTTSLIIGAPISAIFVYVVIKDM